MKNMKESIPISIELSRFTNRLGIIFSNIAIFALILSYMGFFSFLTIAFLILIAGILIILSLGTIFIMIPNFGDFFSSSIKIAANISTFFLDHTYLFTTITLVLAIASFIFFFFDKKNRQIGRMICSVFVCLLALIAIFIMKVGVFS